MSQGIQVDRRVMVLGGTLEASRATRELLALGYAVDWALPGAELPWETLEHSRLTVHAACDLAGLVGHVGGFTARIRQNGTTLSLPAAALVVATGNERYYPAERYGLSLSSTVLTTSQVGKQLDAPQGTGAATPHRHQRVILLLDLGGETPKETATESLHLALRLRREWHCEVYLFYRNLVVDTPGLERLTREMRERGVVFCRYQEPDIALDDEGVTLSYVEGAIRGELLVLPEAVRPAADTARLADMLQVRVGQDGYFQDVNVRQYRTGLSNRRGIFFAGRCHLDSDVHGAEADALQAAANVDALLGSGALEPEDVIAHVDSDKCIRCLTCIRTCPHIAVELADQGDVIAARVVDLACRGCGACVTNCPVQAIELVGQAVPLWMQVG